MAAIRILARIQFYAEINQGRSIVPEGPPGTEMESEMVLTASKPEDITVYGLKGLLMNLLLDFFDDVRNLDPTSGVPAMRERLRQYLIQLAAQESTHADDHS